MAPYFTTKKVDGTWQTQGQPNQKFGHQIQREAGEKPDGVYAQWDWDGTTLHIKNDRYGMYPLYYYSTHDSFGISNSIRQLLEGGAPGQLNFSGLGVFLRLGFFIKNDTAFESIYSLPPVQECYWRDGRLTLIPEYPQISQQDMPREEAMDQYIDRFRISIRKRLPQNHKNLLFLTGGRDSRHILFEFLKTDVKPDVCLTSNGHPSTADADVVVAKQITERFHLNHEIVTLPRAQIAFEKRKNEMVQGNLRPLNRAVPEYF